VAPADLTIDPPETDRLLEGLVVGEACRRGSALLRKYEHDAGPIGVIEPKPLTPSARARDNQFSAFTADRVLLASSPRQAIEGRNRSRKCDAARMRQRSRMTPERR